MRVLPLIYGSWDPEGCKMGLSERWGEDATFAGVRQSWDLARVGGEKGAGPSTRPSPATTSCEERVELLTVCRP